MLILLIYIFLDKCYNNYLFIEYVFIINNKYVGGNVVSTFPSQYERSQF